MLLCQYKTLPSPFCSGASVEGDLRPGDGIARALGDLAHKSWKRREEEGEQGTLEKRNMSERVWTKFWDLKDIDQRISKREKREPLGSQRKSASRSKSI